MSDQKKLHPIRVHLERGTRVVACGMPPFMARMEADSWHTTKWLRALSSRATARHPMRFRLRKAGCYAISSRCYHSDPAPTPSLSHSIARMLIRKTPRHARHAHPRLTLQPPPPDSRTWAKDRGTVLHKLILGEGEQFSAVKADAWTTKDARHQRDEARAAGRIPVLAHQLNDLEICAREVLAQMRDIPACADFFAPGRSEVTMMWRTAGFWCRSLVDRLPNRPGAALFDLKSTGISAAPDEYSRTIERDYATQAAFYLRGASTLFGVPPATFRFVVFETDAPYAVSIFEPDETLLEIADVEIRKAFRLWARGLKMNDWPGYPIEPHRVVPSVAAMIRSEEAKLQWSNAA